MAWPQLAAAFATVLSGCAVKLCVWMEIHLCDMTSLLEIPVQRCIGQTPDPFPHSFGKGSGYTRPAFLGWLEELFLSHAVSGRPLLLLVDGHSSHYDPEAIKFAKELSIEVFCLPPSLLTKPRH